MKVEIDIPDGVLKKLKALSILSPLEGGIETAISHGIENWVDSQILQHITGRPEQAVIQRGSEHLTRADPPPPPSRRRGQRVIQSTPEDTSAYDASGISDGLSDDVDDFEDELRTSDPEAFIKPTGGLTEEAMDRDMRVADPAHEAKVDASVIKEKKLTGSDSYRTPEQLFADHSGLPTPPVVDDERAKKRLKKQTGRGRASHFTGVEENTI